MINGIINVYKEKGYTSHDVVAKLRGILKQKKIGHTGTLDPDAEGVLPVCLGKGTKLCDMLADETKTYVAGLYLGIVTDTQDMSGRVLAEKTTEGVTIEAAEHAVLSFCGEQMQIPPMYSALKVGGKKLYELARQGVEVERKPRPVTFYKIQIRKIALPRVEMEVTCSKGTYIRTLCHDIGQKLGVGGCMESLVRTRVGRFFIEDSLTLDEIAMEAGGNLSCVHSVEEMFEELPKVTAQEDCEKALLNGNSFVMKEILEMDTLVRMYTCKGEFIGIYRYENSRKTFHVEKMFYPCEKYS